MELPGQSLGNVQRVGGFRNASAAQGGAATALTALGVPYPLYTPVSSPLLFCFFMGILFQAKALEVSKTGQLPKEELARMRAEIVSNGAIFMGP